MAPYWRKYVYLELLAGEGGQHRRRLTIERELNIGILILIILLEHFCYYGWLLFNGIHSEIIKNLAQLNFLVLI